MYVTLEPCAHQGRQPPCVEAILEAGIARVVIASDDPSEKAAGRGPGILRDGGVEVELRRRRRGDRGPAAQPALPQARPHRPAAGHPEDGDVPRRPDRDRARRLALDLGRARAASWSTAGAPNPTRSRSASAPSSPTTRCSPPATSTAPASRSASSSTRQARLPLDSQLLRTLDQAPVLVVVGPEAPSRPRRRPARAPAPRSSSPTATIDAPPSRARPPRHHQPLPRGRPDPRRRLRRRRRDRRVAYLRRPGAARRLGDAPDGRGSTRGAARCDALDRSHVREVGDDVLITARFKEW